MLAYKSKIACEKVPAEKVPGTSCRLTADQKPQNKRSDTQAPADLSILLAGVAAPCRSRHIGACSLAVHVQLQNLHCR